MRRTGKGVLIMAGGTGGHIFPGLAVAEVLRKKNITVRWLGAEGGMETRTVPAADIELDVVAIAGLRGKGLMRWVHMPFMLLRAVWHARRLLEANRPGCAVSFGGYAAAPGGIAAFLEREVLPYSPGAWYDPDKVRVGYEISFTRYFYKPQPIRELPEIIADIRALERETGGLLDEIIGGGA